MVESISSISIHCIILQILSGHDFEFQPISFNFPSINNCKFTVKECSQNDKLHLHQEKKSKKVIKSDSKVACGTFSIKTNIYDIFLKHLMFDFFGNYFETLSNNIVFAQVCFRYLD